MFRKLSKTLIFLILQFSFVITFSQFNPNAKFRVEFKDKHNTIYSLNQPEQFLSQRAIDRRLNQGISIDSTDLPVNQNYINAVLQIGGTLMHTSKWFNSITIALADTSVLSQIKNLSFVSRIERTYPFMGKKNINTRFTTDKLKAENTSILSNNNLNNLVNKKNFNTRNFNYGDANNQNLMIGIDYLHALGYSGESMIITVLDAGFFQVNNLGVFDSLRFHNRILGTKDFVNLNGDVYVEHSHGMSVLSTMAANSQGILVGTAPHASYWLIRTEDVATEFRIEEDNWIAGAEFADSLGTDIINSSLGYTFFYDPAQDYTYADMDGNTARVTLGANMAVNKGIIVVNSAGNWGGSFWNYIGAPADGFSVLSVGAVDAFGSIASFSSVGPTYDGRVKPDVVAQGSGTSVINSSNQVTSGSGTSFSGPIIAGAVACLWQALPNKTNLEIIELVRKSAHLYPNYNYSYGYGIPNFAAAYILSTNNKPTPPNNPLVLAYPNPFQNEIYLVFHSDTNKKLQIEIVDIKGKTLLPLKDIYLNSGYNNILINELKNYSQGIYFIRLINDNQVFTKRIIKM